MNATQTQSSLNELSLMKNPAKFLKELLIDRKLKNSSYSARALARDLGLSPAFLSQVMSGKRNLSLEQKLKLASQLGIEVSHATSGENKKPEMMFDVIQQTLEHEKILKHWYHFVILEMTKTGELTAHYGTLAKRLGISEIEVKSAVERLIDFGYLQVEKKKLVRTTTPFVIQNKKSSQALREFHQSRLLAAHEELQHFEQARTDNRLFQTLFIPTSAKKVQAAKSIVTQFQNKLIAFLMEDQPDEVFQLSLQLFTAENPTQNRKNNKGRAP